MRGWVFRRRLCGFIVEEFLVLERDRDRAGFGEVWDMGIRRAYYKCGIFRKLYREFFLVVYGIF